MGLFTVVNIEQKTLYTMTLNVEFSVPHNPSLKKARVEYSTSDINNWDEFYYPFQEKHKEQIINFLDEEIGYGPFKDSLIKELKEKIDNNNFRTDIRF